MSSSTTRLSKDYPAPSAAGVIKRLLRAALVAEGELEPSPLPIGNDLVKVFGRIDSGVIDDVA